MTAILNVRRAVGLAAAAALIFVAGFVASAEAHDTGHDGPAASSAAPGMPNSPGPFPVAIDGGFDLVDHTGTRRRDEDFRGRYLLVFFGYGNCDGICPTGLRSMTEAVDLLGEKAASVTPVLITVDPVRDTPEALGEAVAAIHPRLIGLTGDPERLRDARKAYNVEAAKVGERWQDGGDVFSHGSYIYLMGRDGKLLTIVPPILPTPQMASILARYVAE